MPRSLDAPGGDDDAPAFEEEKPTPVFAAGTLSSLADAAREATRRASDAVPGEDVAALAHDLKNPLTIIMLEAMQIEQRLGSRTSPGVQRGLERISQNAAYIDRLVSDLLDMSSADAGKLDLRLERIDLSRLLRDAVGRSVPTQDRGRVKLEIRDVMYALGDETRIERVVSNLVHNALKYGAESNRHGSPRCARRLRMRLGDRLGSGAQRGRSAPRVRALSPHRRTARTDWPRSRAVHESPHHRSAQGSHRHRQPTRPRLAVLLRVPAVART